MSDYSVKVPHSVGECGARSLIERFLEDLRHEPELTVHKSRTKLKGNRGQFSCSAMGADINGVIGILPDCIVVNGNAPRLGVGRVKRMIEERLTKLFDLKPWKPRLPLSYKR